MLSTTIVICCRHLNVVTGDTKNFHAWKYRSWLVERAGKSPHSEEEYTRSLLDAEPNNFSALHHRIVALAAAHTSCSDASDVAGSMCSSRDATQQASTDEPMIARDEHLPASDATIPTDATEALGASQSATVATTPEQTTAIHVAKMQYSGARVLPISLDVIERELKAVYEVRKSLCGVTAPSSEQRRQKHHRDPLAGVTVVLLAPLLWLGWPCAAPSPPLLRVLRPIPLGVGVICYPFFSCDCFSLFGNETISVGLHA